MDGAQNQFMNPERIKKDRKQISIDNKKKML